MPGAPDSSPVRMMWVDATAGAAGDLLLDVAETAINLGTTQPTWVFKL